MLVRFSDSEQRSSPVKPPRSQNYVKPHDARTGAVVPAPSTGSAPSVISRPTTFVSTVFSCYLTVMGLPRDLIRTIGHLKTTSALAPLSMPAGLIGVFAVLMTIVGGPHHPLTWVLWIFFMVWLVAIFGAYIFWSIKSPDRLQTENYQLEQQRIKVIGDERNPGKVIEGAPLTSNTAMQVSK